MFAGDPDGAAKAAAIAKCLADHKEFKSHGRPVHREAAAKMGLVIDRIEDDQKLQDHVLSVFHITMHIFSGLPHIAKTVQNHLGNMFIKIQGIQIQQLVQQGGPPANPAAQPPKGAPGGP